MQKPQRHRDMRECRKHIIEAYQPSRLHAHNPITNHHTPFRTDEGVENKLLNIPPLLCVSAPSRFKNYLQNLIKKVNPSA